MISYTTAWAQKSTQTLEQWQQWARSLKIGDKCLFQRFIPRGNFCLDSQYEMWRFWPAIYRGDRVVYDNDDHPLRDGYATYWGSDIHWGEVFDARIVPVHHDVSPLEGHRFRDCHAPVFDEHWTPREVHRHLLLIKKGADRHHAIRRLIKEKFPRSYSREVYQGDLYTIFTSWEDEDALRAIEGATYLYCEKIH